MSESLPPPTTQTLPTDLAPVETWLDGLSNGEATVLGFGLTVLVSVLVWLFTRKKAETPPPPPSNTVSPTITVSPVITVNSAPTPLPAVISNEPTTPEHIHSDRLPTVKGGFFGREVELQLLNNAWSGTTPTTTVETQNLASLRWWWVLCQTMRCSAIAVRLHVRRSRL